ncbi:MAG: peptidoglycan DD-metalloendopeptidase family protein [Colwellia sp.]|nr:peptidoglycan DD-metalloendopeptidase family protein [Colwellia sp.]
MKPVNRKLICYCWSSLTVLIILLSGCSTRSTPAPVVTAYGSVPLKDRIKNSINSTYYTVKKGETLYSIAWRANSDVRTVAKLNKISSPYNIFPGQKLIVAQKKTSKPSQASTHKSYAKNSNKSSSSISKNSVKKVVAPNKKQEYGKTVSEEKVNKKSALQSSPFSTKIREWQWPANGKVIARFSTAQQGNKGIDIAGRRGDKVKAAADGKVVYAGSALSGYGQLIIVKHNDDYLSAYAHNDKILVKEKQLVKTGDVIASMGDTDAQRVMLHFEVRFRGKSVNPMKYLPRK